MPTLDRAARETDGTRATLLCPRCESTVLIDRQCKTICAGCGYVESCEDNFVPTQDNPQGDVLG